MPAKKSPRIDWEDMRVVLAIAQHKSLTRAARSLQVTQPTAGRQLAAIEDKVGAALFERTSAGLVANELGRSILDDIEKMDASAEAVQRRLAGKDARLRGAVRITCLGWFGSHVLAPICARFGRIHPEITVELASDPRHFSLGKREADLAFRFLRFEPLDVVQRKLGNLELCLYASPDYLEMAGAPDFDTALEGHAIVVLDAPQVPDARWLVEIAAGARIAVRSNSSEALLKSAESGAGLAVLPRYVGDASPRLVRLAPPRPPPHRPIWVGVHKDMQHVPRIRAFLEFVIPAIARLNLGPR